MFWKSKIDKKMVNNVRPTSKIALKQSCLMIAKGDLELAEKLYDFYIKDMDDLPTFDVVPPTTLQQLKDGAMQTFSWLNQNQEQVMNWVGIIKDMLGKGGGNSAMHQSVQSIPSIN